MREAHKYSTLSIFTMITREKANRVLEERGADAAVAFVLSIHTDEHHII